MDTNQLMHRLAGQSPRVRRLTAPWRRAMLWLAIALPYVAAVIYFHSADGHPSAIAADPQFVIEQLAALATSVTAAIAAFCSVVPGYDRRILFAPTVPLAIWLLSLGEGCVRDWIRSGADGLELHADWNCLPPAAVIGIVPALAIVIMLRRGAPLYPRMSLALAALAVAALGNFGLRFYHIGDATIMILVWHFGSVILLSLAAGWIGRSILNWKSAGAAFPA